ncbi:addiction module protein [Accumulibacter sp.]|uniref:addiction module protein n=1 Tax=Accumulibacter sp. TaxID=2053492 RepID=UPI0028C3FF91|nr:addiction module protein [Accumulibacter sp.]
MNARVQALIEQARSMTAEERLVALDALQELVVPPDKDWEAAWARESENRLDAYLRGDIQAEDFDVMMTRMRREFLDQR